MRQLYPWERRASRALFLVGWRDARDLDKGWRAA